MWTWLCLLIKTRWQLQHVFLFLIIDSKMMFQSYRPLKASRIICWTKVLTVLLVYLSSIIINSDTLNFFYKKPRVRGSGSAFLRIPEFESQKFLRSIKIPVFSFLTFSYFEPLIFLKFYTKNTSRTIILDFWSKELSFCIKCWWNWYPTE